MTAEFDYVIIGSGVAGALVAKQLLNANPMASIAVIEAGKRVPLRDRRKWWDFISTGVNPYDDFHDLPIAQENQSAGCLLYTSPSPRDRTRSRMPSSA